MPRHALWIGLWGLLSQMPVVAEEVPARELLMLAAGDAVAPPPMDPGIRLEGYVDVSYAYGLNGGGTDRGLGGVGLNYVTAEESNDFSVSAVRVALERPLPKEPRWAAGFRFDLYLGEFGKYIADSGLGGGSGALLLENAYVQARLPVGNGLDFQLGKWQTLLGYESVDRAKNNQVTLGLLPRFMEHSAHTGLLFLYQFSPRVGARLGICNGRNNADSDFLDAGSFGTDAPSDFAKTITGGTMMFNRDFNAWIRFVFAYSPDGDKWAGNVFPGTADGSHMGPDGRPMAENDGLLALTLCGNWRPKFATGRLELAFNLECVTAEDNLRRTDWGNGAIGADANSSTIWGAALFGKYSVLPWLHLSTRFEYLHSDDGTLGAFDRIVLAGPGASLDENGVYVTGADLWSAALTAAVDVADGLQIKLEYRADLGSSDGGGEAVFSAFGTGDSHQHTFAVQAVYKFW